MILDNNVDFQDLKNALMFNMIKECLHFLFISYSVLQDYISNEPRPIHVN